MHYGVLDIGLDWHFRIAATPQERHRFIEQENGNEMTRWRILTTGWMGVSAEYFFNDEDGGCCAECCSKKDRGRDDPMFI